MAASVCIHLFIRNDYLETQEYKLVEGGLQKILRNDDSKVNKLITV